VEKVFDSLKHRSNNNDIELSKFSMKDLSKVTSKIDTHYKPKYELSPLKNELLNFNINRTRSKMNKRFSNDLLERPQTRDKYGARILQNSIPKTPSYSNMKLQSISNNKRLKMFNIPDELIDYDKI
jgi:hypothetical protein